MKDKEIALSLGAMFLVYGTLLFAELFNILNFLSPEIRHEISDWRSLFIYGAASFLVFKKNKIWGLCLLTAGLALRLNFISGFIGAYNHMLIPLLFIILSLLFIVISLKK